MHVNVIWNLSKQYLISISTLCAGNGGWGKNAQLNANNKGTKLKPLIKTRATINYNETPNK